MDEKVDIMIYVVSKRYGACLDKPEVFKTKQEAVDYMRREVTEEMYNEVKDRELDGYEELEEKFGISSYEDFKTLDNDTILKIALWGQEKGYCSLSMNNSMVEISDDWTEFLITRHKFKLQGKTA